MGNIHTLQSATILAVSINDSAHESEILLCVDSEAESVGSNVGLCSAVNVNDTNPLVSFIA